MYRSTVLICGGTGCHSNHSGEIYDEFVSQLAANNLTNEVKALSTAP